MKTVGALAEALGASLGIVRRDDTRAMRREQARRKARQLVAITQGSAALEGQAVDDRTVRKAVRGVAKGLLAGPAIRLWS